MARVPIGRFGCPAPTVTVADAGQLRRALALAGPGDVIQLADGVYSGHFDAKVSGSTTAPIYLCGGRAAVLAGRSTAAGYALHFDRVAHWRVSGFSIRHVQKGVVLDASTDVGLQDLLIERIGYEGVHLRTNSVRNVVRGLSIRNTGLVYAESGEGVYVGSPKKFWGTFTGGRPDRSDDNYVKGNSWLITGNRGVNTLKDGFQVHVVLAGWGRGNVFSDNHADLAGSAAGLGIWVQEALGNRVSCTNRTTLHRPVSNLHCSRP